MTFDSAMIGFPTIIFVFSSGKVRDRIIKAIPSLLSNYRHLQ
ncbi:hypothetical protein BSSX_2080 [Bacillus subtilis]|nr:hypothetical protein BSSX_2080 [Bacillus subtilis]